MSWSWSKYEDEVTKSYEPMGTVTISCEEYRDLLTRTIELKAAGQREHDDWFEGTKKIDRLEKDLNKANDTIAKFEQYKSFVEQDPGIHSQFKLWKLEQEEENNKEEDN